MVVPYGLEGDMRELLQDKNFPCPLSLSINKHCRDGNWGDLYNQISHLAWVGEKHFSSWLWALEKMHHNLSHERDLCNFPADRNIFLSPHVFFWVTSRENALNQHILQERQIMTFESLMLIAQLLLFCPGSLALSRDLVTCLSSWTFERHLGEERGNIITCIFSLCYVILNIKLEGKKKNIEAISFAKVEENSFSSWSVALLFFFASAAFKLFCKWTRFCVLEEHCVPPSDCQAQVEVW